MKNEINDQLVLDVLKKYKYWNNNISNDILQYCKNRYKDIQPYTNKISEFIYRLENKIEKAPTCPVCGKRLPFLTYRNGYRAVCSKTCKYSMTGISIMKFNRRKNDKELYIDQLNNINTIINEHKNNNITNDDVIQLFIKNNKPIASRLNIKYLLRNELYDMISYLANKYNGYDITKTKVVSEIVYRIVNNINEIPKCEICGKILQYGNFFVGYGKYCKECVSNKKQLMKHVLIKSRQTYKEKTGVENPFGNKIVRQQIKNKWIQNGYDNPMHNINTVNKIDYIRKNKHTLNTSKPEERLYINLINLFGENDVYRNYKSKLYRWKCDFYIDSIKLYIELQGTWQHGWHPYDKNNLDDIKKLEEWKTKSEEINHYGHKKYGYLDAIKRWTISDPLKRQTAKDNNLNYLEIFSCNEKEIMEQIENFIKNL